MGYLGKEALERLITNVYKIKIKNLIVFNYEACVQTKVKRQILQRQFSRIAPRLFWRIRFDIFELERAYNQLKYALVIQDEFTGYIWAYLVAGKTQDEFI